MANARLVEMTVRNLLKTADEVGAKIKPTLRKDITARFDLLTAANTVDLNGPSVPDAMADALLAKRDPMADPAVREAVIRQQLQNQQAGLSISAGEKLERLIADHIDELVDAFKPVYDANGAELGKAHAVMKERGVPEIDSALVASSDMEAAAANYAARNAREILRSIDVVIHPLLSLFSRINGANTGRVLQFADAGDATTGTIMQKLRYDHWTALEAGFTIRLANPTDTMARVEHARAMQEREQNRATEQARQKFGGAVVSGHFN